MPPTYMYTIDNGPGDRNGGCVHRWKRAAARHAEGARRASRRGVRAGERETTRKAGRSNVLRAELVATEGERDHPDLNAYGNWPGGDDEEEDEGEGGGGAGTARSEETGAHMAEATGDAAQQAAAGADGSERTDGVTAEGAEGEAARRDDGRAAAPAGARVPESRDDEATGPATPVRAPARVRRHLGHMARQGRLPRYWTLGMTKG